MGILFTHASIYMVSTDWSLVNTFPVFGSLYFLKDSLIARKSTLADDFDALL